MSRIGNEYDEIKALVGDVRYLAQAVLDLTQALNADPGVSNHIDYRAVVVPHLRKVAMDILKPIERRPSSV